MWYEVPIERGKIREFARAAKSANCAYDGPLAIVPLTFLTTARVTWQPTQDDPLQQLHFDLRRVLHGEEEYIFHGPLPHAGEVLTARSEIAERYEKEGKRGGALRFAVLRTEFRDASQVLVAEQRTTLVETAKPPTEAGEAEG